jgi:hypothetical protein
MVINHLPVPLASRLGGIFGLTAALGRAGFHRHWLTGGALDRVLDVLDRGNRAITREIDS